MAEAPILVIGGGPAGASAAATLAESGLPVLLIEQRDQLGGAIHRQPAAGSENPIWRPARHRRSWAALMARLRASAGRIEMKTETIFLGVDGEGRFLFDDRRADRVFAHRPRAAIIAVGAVETIRPFPGWELPGVMTVGGAQVLLKETGRPPEGPILVAGSGPLLPALAAQLARAGNPPVAVLERGRPLRARGHWLVSPSPAARSARPRSMRRRSRSMASPIAAAPLSRELSRMATVSRSASAPARASKPCASGIS